MENGFIVLHRKMLDWEWADDPLTGWLWVRLLLMVNHKDKKWRGIVIKRGQVVTKYGELAKITGLSEWQVRTRLKTLEECGCLTKAATNKYSVITICNYDSYQYDGSATTTLKPQAKPHSNHKQTTSKTQCVSEGYEDLEKPSHTQNHTQTTTTKQIYNNINIDVVDITRTCEENFLESKINDWKNADMVSQNNIPDLTPQWIEDVRLLVRRFNQKELTADEVCRYYEDFKAQENNETLQDTYANWRRHFNNFIRKRIKRQEDERDIKAAQDYNSPEARAKRQEGYARVMQKLIAEGQQPKKDDKLPF